MSTWSIIFTGKTSNVREIRRLVGRMQNMDGDVDINILRKKRGGPWVVWNERTITWVPIYPGDTLHKRGDMWVPKYSLMPDLEVERD
jgi:hypothetical protein